MADRARAHSVKNFEEIRMERRLAAGDLDEVGLAFAFDQGVEHLLDLRKRRERGARRRGFGKADRAGQVAVFGGLDQREARMLLVVAAESAVIGAAIFGAAL